MYVYKPINEIVEYGRPGKSVLGTIPKRDIPYCINECRNCNIKNCGHKDMVFINNEIIKESRIA